MEEIFGLVFEVILGGVVGHSDRTMVRGFALRGVHCTHCARPYWYVIQRRATSRDNPYAPRQRKARDDAVQRVTRALERDTDIVPCPHCGGLSEEMLTAARRDWFLPTLAAALMFAHLAALASLTRPVPRPLLWGVISGGISLLLGAVLIRLWHPGRPVHRDGSGGHAAVSAAADPADAVGACLRLSAPEQERLLRGEVLVVSAR